MNITYNPTVTGGFVHHLLELEEIKKAIEPLGLNDDTAHKLIKVIAIATLRDFKVDVNKKLLQERDSAARV